MRRLTTFYISSTHFALFVLLLSVACMHAEEFHDLDDRYSNVDDSSQQNTAAETGYDVESIPEKQQQQQSNTTNRSNNLINRFSQVISRQIMNRFRIHNVRLPGFPFQPPWHKRKNKVDPIAENDDDDTMSLFAGDTKKIGAFCPPEPDASQDHKDGDDSAIDESLVVCEPRTSGDLLLGSCRVSDDTVDNTVSDDEIKSGMIIYVLPHGETLHEDYATKAENDGIDRSISTLNEDDELDNDDEPHLTASRCIVEMGKRYDGNDEVIQYALIHREFHELGNIDVHRKDFAYQPVTLVRHSSFAENNAFKQQYDFNEHELETRLSTYDPGYSSDLPSGDTDQQISFRWWSWIDHFNQFFREGNNVDNSLSDSGAIIPGPTNNNYGGQYGRNLYEEQGGQAFAGGSHGEIWRARRRCPRGDCDDEKEYIVKRLKIELGYPVLEAGLREVYFGELLAREAEASSLVTTYVDHFFREGKKGQIELWIVFENAGPSLRSFLYTSIIDAEGGFAVFQHSPFWRRLRKSIQERRDSDVSLDIIRPVHREASDRSSHPIPEGRLLLKDVMRQILTAVAFLHERGIVHRDIKPSNIMCKAFPKPEGDILPHKIEAVNCVVGDLSSAWDEYSNRNLYASGPSPNDITKEYAPPEVILQRRGQSWSPFSIKNPYSYDSWSIGVVALEMLLGSPNVFSVDQRTTVVLTHKLRKEGASPEDIQRALYLAALSQFCIYVPSQGKRSWPLRSGDPLYDSKIVKESCTLRDFHNALRARDPLGSGFDRSTDTLLHLIWKLLAWDPSDRLSPLEAISHPYFTSTESDTEQDVPSDLILNNFFAHQTPFSGIHNALELQLLQPVEFDASSPISSFTCPKCGKNYEDYNSCHQHARSRKHARFCSYDRSKLPACINAHTMLPTHESYGYCDIQGRRRSIEDFHSVHLFYDKQFYGIFDGHLGNLASKVAASSFYRVIEGRLSNIDNDTISPVWKNRVQTDIENSFEDIHNEIINAVTSSPGRVMNQSGTTATILYVTDLVVVIANVGDSRAVIPQWSPDTISAAQLTVDHIASSPEEQRLIAQRGGSVSTSGGIERVNGILAVSRSLGDIQLSRFLSRTPHVLVSTKTEALKLCGSAYDDKDRPCFVILASDGLWDVMTNQEAVEMVVEAMETNKESAFQLAAEWLTQEAYIRGSSDNIGVCVVEIV